MKPPATLRPVVSAIGLARARMLVSRFQYVDSGAVRSSVYVPKHAVDSHHPITKAIGLEAARCLVTEFAGEVLNLPNCRRFGMEARRDLIWQEHARGVPTSEIARRAGINVRTVRRLIAG